MRPMETMPWMMDTIPNGNKNRGPRIVLNKVKETKAVCESRMLFTGSIRTNVANDANATMKGADVQAKNCEASKNWKILSCSTSSSLNWLILLTKLNSQP